jgi:arginase
MKYAASKYPFFSATSLLSNQSSTYHQSFVFLNLIIGLPAAEPRLLTSEMSISLILAPYHTGILSFRVGAGPDAILAHELVARLEALGLTVTAHTIPPVDSYEGEIGRSFEVIRRVSHAVSEAVDNGSFPIVLAGNCNVSVGVCAGLHKTEDLHIIWFDAHTDLDRPDECLSGYFDGMGMSMIAGKSWKALLGTVPGHRPIDLRKVTYCGVRDLSEDQRCNLEHSGAKFIYGHVDDGIPNDLDFGGQLDQLLSPGSSVPTLIHLDLDCLDTSLGLANEYAAPGGLEEHDLLSCFDIVAAKRQAVGLTVASFNPLLEGGDVIARVAVNVIVRLAQGLTSKPS